VFVDYGAGEFWSGKGVLVEVSPDQTQCRVVVRDSNLITRNRWVHCNHIHPRRQG
jgi:predicted oxidoreductase